MEGVSVVGVGRASAPPDVVVLRLAVEAAAADVPRALEAATAAQAAMRQGLLEEGVAEIDLTTSEMAVWSTTGQDGVSRQTARIGLSVVVHDIAKSGRVLTRALRDGGESSRSEGLRFTHSDPGELLERARSSAFTDARSRAVQIAASSGRRLGQVMSVVELDGHGAPSPRAFAAAAADVAVDAGQQEVVVRLEVHWAWA